MDLQPITLKQKSQYNKLVTHIIQSFEWGEAREKIGTKVLRYGIFKNGRLKSCFQLTLHPIPKTKYFVGYLPKGTNLDKDQAAALRKIGREKNCAFIKLEPNIKVSDKIEIS